MNLSAKSTVSFDLLCNGELDFISQVALVSLHLTSAILSIFGNTIVLLSVYRTRSLQTVSNYFICSLAVADLSVGLIINPLWITKTILNAWHNENILSTVIEFMTLQTIIATTFNLAAVSIEGYIFITKVYQYNDIVTTNRCFFGSIFIWTFSFLYGSVRIVVRGAFEVPKLYLSTVIVGIMTPLIVIVYCQLRIFLVARSQMKSIRTLNAKIYRGNQVREALKNRKAATTIAIIVGLFVILWFPSIPVAGIQFATNNVCFKLKLSRVWYWIAFVNFSNSAFNPWVYPIRCNVFRDAFKKTLHRVCFSLFNHTNKQEKN